MAIWAAGWWSVAHAGSACSEARPDIVINELLANPDGTDTDLEWVEIHNGSGEAIDLSGWTVASGTSELRDSDPLPEGTTLAAGGYLVVAQAPIPEAGVVAAGFTLGNASSDADAVQLRDCAGTPSDTLVYGAPNDDGWIDDAGDPATSLGPEPPDGGTLGRDPDGSDTDRSGDDLVALPWPSPGAPNDAPPETCGGPGSGLVVNEIFPDPPGDDDGYEWIELYHSGTAILDLAGWSVESGTSSPSVRLTWERGTIRPGEFLLLGGSGLPVDGLSLGNASTDADVVRIVDCLGFPSDTLVYGSPNDDGFLDDLGRIASSLAPVPGSGIALQRIADGVDTDRCGDDFVLGSSPTPGAPNTVLVPHACEPTVGAIVLNEIFVDPEGVDDGREWLELYNGSEFARALAGWSLSFATADFGEPDLVFGELSIPARGFLVIGGGAVDPVDLVADLVLPNGTGTDGIRLSDCHGTPVDTLLYGAAPNLDLVPDDRGEVPDPYGDPASDESLARVHDGIDTDSADDWKVVGLPTPGAVNARDPGTAFDPGAGGCAGPPGPTSEVGGCTTASPGHSPLPLMLGLLAALRLGTGRRTQRSYFAIARWIVGVVGPR